MSGHADIARLRELPEASSLRAELTALLKQKTGSQEDVFTAIPGLALYRRTTPVVEACNFYVPGLALIVQGSKQVELGGKSYSYDESCFLLTSVELPTINRVLDASADRPYLAMVLHLDLLAAKDLVAQYDLHHRGRVPIPRAIGTGPATKEVMNAFLRLLWLLDAPQDIPFLAGLLQRELLYRLMTTDEGIRLRETVAADTPMNRVALAIM